MKKEKRLSTILGVVLVLALVSSLSMLEQVRTFFSGASGSVDPQEVMVTNITNNSFVASWITSKKTSGIVELVGGDKKLFPDLRSKSGELGDYTTHYVEVNGLESGKRYQFIIVSGGERFFESGQTPYQATTAKSISEDLPKANLASGTVVDKSSNPAIGAIVYVGLEGIAPLSSIVTTQGNWVISLSKAFTADLSGLASYQEGEVLETILVQGGEMGMASAVVYTLDDDPVQPIVLGEQYDFTNNNGDMVPPIENSSLESTSSQESVLEGRNQVNPSEKEFEILNPGDGDVVGFPRPEILGTGPGGAKLKITLESPVTYEAEVEIDETGDWQWAPPQDLTPGSHTLTVEYTDPETGQQESFIRTFVLAANSSGDDPSFSATPSAATVTPTSMPTPVSSPSATPVLTASPTATMTPTVPPRTSQPSTESGVPVSGFWQPTFILIGVALLLFLLLTLGLIF